mmetsp:Transcript_25290/g.84465  ORF Transcript_25290/g.84465 Transcript_25290/m.84465 type:complete len:709 (+) Transcript_25290:2926-5052(+)
MVPTTDPFHLDLAVWCGPQAFRVKGFRADIAQEVARRRHILAIRALLLHVLFEFLLRAPSTAATATAAASAPLPAPPGRGGAGAEAASEARGEVFDHILRLRCLHPLPLLEFLLHLRQRDGVRARGLADDPPRRCPGQRHVLRQTDGSPFLSAAAAAAACYTRRHRWRRHHFDICVHWRCVAAQAFNVNIGLLQAGKEARFACCFVGDILLLWQWAPLPLQQPLQRTMRYALALEAVHGGLAVPHHGKNLPRTQPLWWPRCNVAIFGAVGRRTAILIDDAMLHLEFLALAVHQPLLDAPLLHEPVHCDGAPLPNAVCTVNGLEVHVGVPILLEEDDVVGKGKVDPKTTRSRADEVNEIVLILAVEVSHVQLSEHPRGAAVHAQIPEATQFAVSLEHVQGRVELGKDQDLVRPWDAFVASNLLPNCSGRALLDRGLRLLRCWRRLRRALRSSNLLRGRRRGSESCIAFLLWRNCCMRLLKVPHVVQEQKALGVPQPHCRRHHLPLPAALLLAILPSFSPLRAEAHVLCMQVGQQLVKELDLATLSHEFLGQTIARKKLVQSLGVDGLLPIRKSEPLEFFCVGSIPGNPSGMAADLPQAHQELHQDPDSSLLHSPARPQQLLVPLRLAWSQRQPHIIEDLGGQADDVLLFPAQHQGAQQGSDLADLLLVHSCFYGLRQASVRRPACGLVHQHPSLLEAVGLTEDVRPEVA